jgi:class 3 adenylate cyclase
VKETTLVLFAADLAGWTRATAGLDALAVADLASDWYRRCNRAITNRGGRVVKFMGDGCFATFDEGRTKDAVDAASDLETEASSLARERGLPIQVGTNIHVAVVAEGEVDVGGDLRRDVFGSGVNDLFRMGSGPGIRISNAAKGSP